MKQGQIVISKKGRDKGRMMVVLAVEAETKTKYVLLADGRLRTLSKPKKKKAMHVQPTNQFVDLTKIGPRGLQDADIRKMLAITEGNGFGGAEGGKEVSPLGEG